MKRQHYYNFHPAKVSDFLETHNVWNIFAHLRFAKHLRTYKGHRTKITLRLDGFHVWAFWGDAWHEMSLKRL